VADETAADAGSVAPVADAARVAPVADAASIGELMAVARLTSGRSGLKGACRDGSRCPGCAKTNDYEG
jgi:hypothetical protein